MEHNATSFQHNAAPHSVHGGDGVERGAPEFDSFAGHYRDALHKGISVSGEHQEFFALGRMQWLARCLAHAPASAPAMMDFGCGTGTSVGMMLEHLGAKSVVGIDVSEQSLVNARVQHADPRVTFLTPERFDPQEQIDIAFCNGVFHHIPLAERAGALDYVYRSLRPGGTFAMWENNPWSLAARYVMSRIPFDHDAIMVYPSGARSMLRRAGFEILRTDFLFIFPRVLGWLRGVEPLVSRLPLGAQYQVLCRKPG